MLEFIAKYWLEFVFGLLATGLLAWIKHDIKAYKQIQMQNRKEFQEQIETNFDAKLQATVDDLQITDQTFRADLDSVHASLETITVGLLSVQGKAFREQCRKLLDPSHVITLDEYEQLVEDHDAYNELGGNHRGDQLFDAAKIKYHAQFSEKK